MVRKKSLNSIIFLIIIILAAVLLLRNVILSRVGRDPEITGLRAEFAGTIAPGESFSPDMFKVRGITEDSRLVVLKKYQIKDEKAALNGPSCEATITSQGYETTVVVPIDREEIASMSIGYPYKEDVKVTCYSNGDLEFSGNGDVQNFGLKVPWADYEYTHVYFDDNLTITKMDQWFKGNKELRYISALPKTVKSIKDLANGCEQLKAAPDYFQCKDLKIMDNAFSGCILLETIDVLPVSVTSARYAFSNCVSLQDPCDMTKTSDLTDISGIHAGCTSMRNAPEIPETVAYMDESFKGCINVPYATKFPDNVQSIRGAYAECTNLETASTVPEKAKDISQCYSGCSALSGTLEINTDTKSFNGFLRNSVTMGDTLSISGNSGNLLAIQQDSNSNNIILADPEAAARQNERMQAEESGSK